MFGGNGQKSHYQEERDKQFDIRANVYENQWSIEVWKAPCESPGYCCFSVFCSYCASWSLRKQQLGGDLSRYICCNGHCPCSGKMKEQECPAFCLAMEVCCCFSQSVASTRWGIQDELRVKNSKCDNCLIGFMIFMQYLSCVCHIAACLTQNEDLQDLADLIDCIAQMVYCSVCACMQTQHKVELDKRDKLGTFTGPPMPQHIPMGPGYGGPPPQGGGYPGGYPQGGYPQGGYPPQQGGYPQGGYPPQQGGYPQGGYPPPQQQGGYGYPPPQPGYGAPPPGYPAPPQQQMGYR